MIKIKTENSFTHNFKDIPIGQVFKLKNSIYIKIDEVKMLSGICVANAVYLDSERPSAVHIGDKEKVIPYTNAELILSF